MNAEELRRAVLDLCDIEAAEWREHADGDMRSGAVMALRVLRRRVDSLEIGDES